MKRLKKVPNISARTIERSKKLSVIELGEGRFAVSSNSKPDGGYLVQIKEGCSCKGFQFRSDCAHVKRVESFLAEKNNRKPQPTSA